MKMTPTDCWEWKGNIDYYGYGVFRVNGKSLKAHRVSYELFKESIPVGMVIDHLCYVTKCVNPTHLRITTIKDNARRNRQLLKTYCPQGHAYEGKNLYIDNDGARRCRMCAHIRYKTQVKLGVGAINTTDQDDE